ncbi:CRISPR-associated DxTHG motif protein, partial [Citrobacter freundii]|nr:CRISPR-associated DxTHG motif protein [Citrobacter freundii]
MSHAHGFRYLTLLAVLTAISAQAATSSEQAVPGI